MKIARDNKIELVYQLQMCIILRYKDAYQTLQLYLTHTTVCSLKNTYNIG